VPIRAELRKFYKGPGWEAKRAKILKRAGNCCEFCRKPNGKLVYVTRDGTGRWSEALTQKYRSVKILVKRIMEENPLATSKAAKRFTELWRWFGSDGKALPASFPPGEKDDGQCPESGYIFCIKVVLTIAHLNHTPGDDREENLKALCQRCHLAFDKDHHREMRATRKDKQRPILVEIERQAAQQ